MTAALRSQRYQEHKAQAIALFTEYQGNISMKELGLLVGVSEHEASRYISQWFNERKKQ
jgi:hypothetical protein